MQQPEYFTFGIQADTSPLIDPRMLLPRTDETDSLINLLGEPVTRAVVLTGAEGVGKSTLAALAFGQLKVREGEGVASDLPRFQHYIWLRPGPRATWPDVTAALFNLLQPS